MLEDQGRADSYRRALLGRLRQIIRAAVRDGLLHRNVAEDVKVTMRRRDVRLVSVDQAWALHDAMPEHMRAVVILGAFAGLRVGEVCGLRVQDVDTIAHLVKPRVQYPAAPLKSETSRDDVPIPETMSRQLADHIRAHARDGHLFVNQWGDQMHPRVVERWFREARDTVRAAEDQAGELPEDRRVPADFRFHDLRHVYASYLIGAGLDVKVVQKRMRHATATLTLDTYADLWPKADDGTRDAVGAAFAGREGPMLQAV